MINQVSSTPVQTNSKLEKAGVVAQEMLEVGAEGEFALALSAIDNAIDAEALALAAPQAPAAFPLDMAIEGEPVPKLLDGKLIQSVEEAMMVGEEELAPKQVKDLLVHRAMGPSRAPSIDFAPSEVDPQLMNFEDFVAQKKAVTAKNVGAGAYGLPAKSLMKPATEAGALQTVIPEAKVVNPQWSVEAVPATAAALALGSQISDNALNVRQAAPQRVFDMSQLNRLSAQDVDSVLNQVTDYIVQAKAAHEPTVNLKVNHESLGLLDITVNRVQNDVVSISIGTQDSAAKAFLGQHREGLMSQLTQAGIGVSEFKLEQSSNSGRENSAGQQQHHGQDRQFNSESNQRRQEQERRHDLWQLLREKDAA